MLHCACTNLPAGTLQVAFSSIAIALRCYAADVQQGLFHIHHGTVEKAKGSAPNDPSTFVLKDHFAIATHSEASRL